MGRPARRERCLRRWGASCGRDSFEGDRRVAVAGWRVIASTSAIRKLYVDDLATAAAERSRGHGAALLAALAERGRELGCDAVELDSGVQRHAAPASTSGSEWTSRLTTSPGH
ncbi:GNAT family N-acetyltransferase [Georgenia faecalis]|uniref:GNAT family N-acetyltransferase n=1 Tax=Georgenia faecalis TaxID=2483799 RepID=A0ABV9DCV0_9MICO